MTIDVDVDSGPREHDEIWAALLEVNASLRQCRVILQRRLTPRSAEALLEQRVLSSCALSARPTGSPPDHQGWSVRASFANGHLNLLLDPPPGSDSISGSVSLAVGSGVTVAAGCVRCYADHLCMTLGLQTESTLLSTFRSISSFTPENMGDICCRQCQQLLIPVLGKEVLLLPTGFWQACAEIAACEECAPVKGGGHIMAASGRVYVSPQCLIVSSADVSAVALQRDSDGLLLCSCGNTVGETQHAPAEKQPPKQRTSSRAKLNLRNDWRQRGGFCRGAGFSFYKHRVSVSSSPCSLVGYSSARAGAGSFNGAGGEGGHTEDGVKGTREARENDGSEKGKTPSEADIFRNFTEESAVGAQLLATRASRGMSRFVVLPGQPSKFSIADQPSDIGGPEALEIRIVVPELMVVRPSPRDRHGKVVKAMLTELDLPGQGGGGFELRAAKVYYRHRSCSAPAPQCCWMGVPQVSFNAVCRVLDAWADFLPPSSHAPPLVARGATTSCEDGDLDCWQTSFLPLPPRDPAGDGAQDL
eukprot:TRINITY_DN10614_c0_g1_i1.p1 TRINITY_DN10614_c0_g1~~TRINITY_DN10614_c0_g1_i1.p1  ORF type:complete len:531 (-),score=59.60 TRINITY_DN10614_c0_g1_i1:18-1610(-)